MYCNYHKTDDQEWFSMMVDCDEVGIEALTILKNTIKKNLTEAINLDQFEKARDLTHLAEDIQTALISAAQHEESE